jgi:hypothetical protein
MGTNKECIEHLESKLGVVQEGLLRMEETLNRLWTVLMTNHENPNHDNHPGNDGGRQIVFAKTAKLEFPWFAGDDPTEWFNRVHQFFEYQGTTEAKKVSMAAYHLEREANQWWQWIRRMFKDEGHMLSWEKFEEEL